MAVIHKLKKGPWTALIKLIESEPKESTNISFRPREPSTPCRPRPNFIPPRPSKGSHSIPPARLKAPPYLPAQWLSRPTCSVGFQHGPKCIGVCRGWAQRAMPPPPIDGGGKMREERKKEEEREGGERKGKRGGNEGKRKRKRKEEGKEINELREPRGTLWK